MRISGGNLSCILTTADHCRTRMRDATDEGNVHEELIGNPRVAWSTRECPISTEFTSGCRPLSSPSRPICCNTLPKSVDCESREFVPQNDDLQQATHHLEPLSVRTPPSQGAAYCSVPEGQSVFAARDTAEASYFVKSSPTCDDLAADDADQPMDLSMPHSRPLAEENGTPNAEDGLDEKLEMTEPIETTEDFSVVSNRRSVLATVAHLEGWRISDGDRSPVTNVHYADADPNTPPGSLADPQRLVGTTAYFGSNEASFAKKDKNDRRVTPAKTNLHSLHLMERCQDNPSSPDGSCSSKVQTSISRFGRSGESPPLLPRGLAPLPSPRVSTSYPGPAAFGYLATIPTRAESPSDAACLGLASESVPRAIPIQNVTAYVHR